MSKNSFLIAGVVGLVALAGFFLIFSGADLPGKPVSIPKVSEAELNAAMEKARNYPAAPPMQGATSKFTEHYSVGETPPYVHKYYLFTPPSYDPTKKYPLTVLLHGTSRRMEGGKYASTDQLQKHFPMFLLVPVAPEGLVWAAPDERPSAHKMVMGDIQKVMKKYSIDDRRIYISGYSMGGWGTYGMVYHYPDFFAAAAPLCGSWFDELVGYEPMVNTPFLILHGKQDASIGYDRAILAFKSLKTLGADVKMKAYNAGHNIWDTVYSDPRFWHWLYSQQRKDGR